MPTKKAADMKGPKQNEAPKNDKMGKSRGANAQSASTRASKSMGGGSRSGAEATSQRTNGRTNGRAKSR